MSFQLRSFTARRFRIEGDLPSVNDASFTKRLLDRRFQPLSPNEERSFGWVTADNCLDSRFSDESVARGPAAVFSLRIDKRRVNGRLLRAMMDLELRGRRKDVEKNAEGVAGVGGPDGARKPSARKSREEKTELRRALTEELMRNTTPTMDVYTVIVYPRERMVLFGSLSKASNEVFRTLFADTFDVTLSALTPFHRGLELLESKGGSATLASLRRTEFGRPYDEPAPAAEGAAPRRAAIDPALGTQLDVRAAAGRELSEEALS
jgi:hypothetical protein